MKDGDDVGEVQVVSFLSRFIELDCLQSAPFKTISKARELDNL